MTCQMLSDQLRAGYKPCSVGSEDRLYSGRHNYYHRIDHNIQRCLAAQSGAAHRRSRYRARVDLVSRHVLHTCGSVTQAIRYAFGMDFN